MLELTQEELVFFYEASKAKSALVVPVTCLPGEEEFQKITDRNVLIMDTLIAMELVEDTTAKYIGTIESLNASTGKVFRTFYLTPNGVTFFGAKQKGKPN